MTTGEVVIRCPHCGTTQRALGECDACHEAETRYFCTNHTPGQWLDGPACPACGARHGARPRGEPLPPRPPSATGYAGGRAGAPRASAPPPRAPADPPRPPRRRPEPEFPPFDEAPDPTVDPGVEMGRGGAPRYGGRGWPTEVRWPGAPPFRVVRVGAGSVFGCLARLVTSLVVIVTLAALAFFGYCGSI